MNEHWPSCGNGWIVSHHPGHRWDITCSGECRCRWIPNESMSIIFTLPRPKLQKEVIA